MKETLRINPDSRSLLETHGLVGILSVFAFQQGERMDKAGLESWRQRWRIRLQDTRGSNTVFYLKRFNRPPFRRQWSRWKEGHLFTSTAGVEWHNATALAEAGISAAQPAACGEQMIGPWEQRSFILLKEVPGQSLEKWVPQKLSPTTQEENLADRRVRLYELADFVANSSNVTWPHTWVVPKYASMAEYKQFALANHFHMIWDLPVSRLQYWMDLTNVLSVNPWQARPRFIENVDRPEPLLYLLNGGENVTKSLRSK